MRRISVLIVVLNAGTALWGQVAAGGQERPVSWKGLIPNIASDQKQIWTYPVRFAQGSHWKATVGVLAVTAGLVALDPITGKYFHETTAFHGFNSVFTSNATAIGTALVPASLYAAGLIRKDDYQKNTALLAGQAVVNGELVTTVFKGFDRRVRPADLPSDTKYGDTWFESHGNRIRGTGSFPSGHTIAAFSVATVFSRRYGRNHRWVPYTAYGLATLVGFSRMTQSAHFPSDVFMGAAMGYSISRFSVLRQ